MTPGRAVPAVPALIALALAACGSTRSYVPDPGPYDRIPSAWSAQLWRARFAYDDGRLREAHGLLRPLADQRPELLGLRSFLQEVEVGLLEEGQEVGGLRVPDATKARPWLADVYRQRADANPDALSYVLAARLQSRGPAALRLLDEALSIDPDCVWAHYGRAWWNFGLRRFPQARADVEAALQLDRGHLATMRLHASMLASAGDTRPAIVCLVAWLKQGETDALVDPHQRAEAQVDLAALLVLDGQAEEALALSEAIDRSLLREPARAELVRAVALGDLGRLSVALSAARRGKEESPDDLLPLVYQALLLQLQGNVTQERAVWQALLSEATARREAEAIRPFDPEEPGELYLPDLLIELQARTRLERLERGLARRR